MTVRAIRLAEKEGVRYFPDDHDALPLIWWYDRFSHVPAGGSPTVKAATSHFMALHSFTSTLKVGLCSPRSIRPT